MPSPNAATDASTQGPLKQVFDTALKVLHSPSERYRHARLLHGFRVGLALLASILLTTGLDLPYGSWASISLLTVIGGLQHQGNIRQRAAERAVGTAIGAAVGLACVLQQSVFGAPWLTYLLLAIATGACAFHAVGKGGYVALLAGITINIVVEHGQNSVEVGLWRTTDVAIGVALALAFSFALPQYATYSWRDTLSRCLRTHARLYRRILAGAPMASDEHGATFAKLTRDLVALRGLMPSVAKEWHVPVAQLEDIQRLHRAILSSLEMLATVQDSDAGAPLRTQLAQIAQRNGQQVRRHCLVTARALRLGRLDRLLTTPAPAALDDGVQLPLPLQGPYWVMQSLAHQSWELQRRVGRLPSSPDSPIRGA